MPSKPVRLQWVVCVCAAAALPGCGGGSSGGAKSPETSTEGADASAKTPATSGSAAAEVAPPTTTAVADPGDDKGTKLPEAHAAPTPDAGAGLPGRGREPGRTPSDLKALVGAHRDEARACYDKGLADHPGMEGDLVVQWVIDPKGKVSHVTADTSRSQITEPSVVACIGAVIEKLQFAASPGGFETRASYPFNFHPHHGSHPSSP
jgi:hypothetical protein